MGFIRSLIQGIMTQLVFPAGANFRRPVIKQNNTYQFPTKYSIQTLKQARQRQTQSIQRLQSELSTEALKKFRQQLTLPKESRLVEHNRTRIRLNSVSTPEFYPSLLRIT